MSNYFLTPDVWRIKWVFYCKESDGSIIPVEHESYFEDEDSAREFYAKIESAMILLRFSNTITMYRVIPND